VTADLSDIERTDGWLEVLAGLRRRGYGPTDLATVGAISVSALIPVLGVYREAVYPPGHPVQAAVATACVLPLQSWLLWSACRRSSSTTHRWLLGAMAGVIIGLMPVIEAGWLYALLPVAALVLLLLPRPWSVVVFAILVVLPVPMSSALGNPGLAVYLAAGTLMYGIAVAVPVWLVAAIDQLTVARLALAEAAIVRERLRLDAELHLEVVPAIEAMTAYGERASRQALDDASATEDDLRTLVATSRRTLSDVRGMVRRYRAVPARVELRAAATLLAAAGVQASVVLPASAAADTLDEDQRQSLRAGLVEALRDDGVQRCVLTVTNSHGSARVDVFTERAASAPVPSPVA
jgi:two-component system sensor histidine kinase DesK